MEELKKAADKNIQLFGCVNYSPEAFAAHLPLSNDFNHNDWRGNVSCIVAMNWANLSEETRICVFLTAQAFTAWNPNARKPPEEPRTAPC